MKFVRENCLLYSFIQENLNFYIQALSIFIVQNRRTLIKNKTTIDEQLEGHFDGRKLGVSHFQHKQRSIASESWIEFS